MPEEENYHEQSTRSPRTPKRHTVKVSSLVAAVLAAVVVAGLGFLAGVHYGKNHAPASTASTGRLASGTSRAFGGGPGGSFRQNGAFGTVSAISATSITVNDSRTGSTKTYAITSSTTITDNGSTVTYSDISVGDNVIVAASSTATNAARIIVNPQMGGFGGPPSSGSASTN